MPKKGSRRLESPLSQSFFDAGKDEKQPQTLNEYAEAYKRSREMNLIYSRLVDSTRLAIVKIKLDRYLTMIDCNSVNYEMTGYSDSEHHALFNMHSCDFFKGDFKKDYRLLADSIKAALKAKDPRFKINQRLPTRDGFIWISGVGTFSDYDKNHKPQTAYMVFSDITEAMKSKKKLAEAEALLQKQLDLKKENDNLRLIINNVPSGISTCLLSEGGELRFSINSYLSSQIGADPEKMYRIEEIVSFFVPEARAEAEKKLKALLKSGHGSLSAEARLLFKNGEVHWCHIEGQIVHPTSKFKAAFFSFVGIDELKKYAEDLKKTKSVYQMAVNTTRLIMWTFNLKTKRIVMSEDESTVSDCRKFGIPPVNENVPESLFRFVDERSLPQFKEMFEKIFQGQDASCEIWYRAVGNIEARAMRVSYVVIKDEKGEPSLAYGIGQNITAEMKAREIYEREKDYLLRLADNTLVSKGRADITDNKLLSFERKSSLGANLHVGIPYDEVIETFRTLTVSQEEKELIVEKMSAEKLNRAFFAGQTSISLVYRRLDPFKAPAWLKTYINVYQVPENGHLECFIYSYDITGTHMMEEIVSQFSQHNYEQIGFIYINNQTARIFNFQFASRMSSNVKYQEALEQNIQKLPNDVQEGARKALNLENIRKELRDKDSFIYSLRYNDIYGKALEKQLRFSYLDSSMETVFFTLSDVTLEFEHENQQIALLAAARLEAVKANEAKSAFLSSMSHDLRTPLNGIIGFTDFALKEKDPSLKEDYMEKVKSSSELLLELINETLELSRIESGKETLQLEAVPRKKLALSVIEALKPSAVIKGIAIDDRLDHSLDEELLYTDVVKVKKIILNILSNAIKYTPDGGKVTVFNELVDPAAHKGCSEMLSIADTGIGMSEEFMKVMFEPFSQEKRSESINVVGTGLGLSIVKKYLDLLGGYVEVTSKMHVGTTFRLYFPLKKAEAGKKLEEEEKSKEINFKGKRILLAEDNVFNQEIASLLLKEKGISVVLAGDGLQALHRFEESEENYFDAILMDIRMPRMDGHEATDAIRRLERKDAKTVPIIAMSADAFEEDIKAAEEAGMQGYVIKPISPDKLFETLAEHLK